MQKVICVLWLLARNCKRLRLTQTSNPKVHSLQERLVSDLKFYTDVDSDLDQTLVLKSGHFCRLKYDDNFAGLYFLLWIQALHNESA